MFFRLWRAAKDIRVDTTSFHHGDEVAGAITEALHSLVSSRPEWAGTVADAVSKGLVSASVAEASASVVYGNYAVIVRASVVPLDDAGFVLSGIAVYEKGSLPAFRPHWRYVVRQGDGWVTRKRMTNRMKKLWESRKIMSVLQR